MLNGKEPKIVNGPEVLNKYVGASEENIRNLFKASACPSAVCAMCPSQCFPSSLGMSSLVMGHTVAGANDVQVRCLTCMVRPWTMPFMQPMPALTHD